MPSRNLAWIITSIIFYFSCPAYSQDRKKEDVVYLRNHWVLHGHIIFNSQDSLKIQTFGDNIFSFKKDEVLIITREKTPVFYSNKHSGFSDYTELGPLASKNTSQINVNTSAFSFQTVNGYTFTPLLFAGLGLGVDLYATQTFLPLFGSIRGEINTQSTINPYYFLDFGYGFNITSYQNSSFSGQGGLLYALGGGVKINFNRASGFLLSLGYRVQKLSQTDLASQITQSSTYNRVALRAGFYF